MLSIAIKSLFSSSQSNEWLMSRYAQTADNRFLEQLYDNCNQDLYHFLLTQSDAPLARDICQKTWVKVIEKRHLYRDSGRFSAWLFTLARHGLIDEYRRESKYLAQQEGRLNPVEFDAGDGVQQAFNRILSNLPVLQREAFCLQQEGFGLQEISHISGSPIETIKSRIRYAKATIRQQLEKYHDQG